MSARVTVTGIRLADLFRAHGSEDGAIVVQVLVNGRLLVGAAAAAYLERDGVTYDLHDQKPSEAQEWYERNSRAAEKGEP